MNYTLRRRYFEFGTFSYLYRPDGSKVCAFVERADKNNAPNVSCVPEGTYRWLPHESPKFGSCYALEAETLGVTRYGPSLRTYILTHKANKPEQLEGCLAPGVDFGILDGDWAVLNSTAAFNALMQELGGKEHTLTIVRD